MERHLESALFLSRLESDSPSRPPDVKVCSPKATRAHLQASRILRKSGHHFRDRFPNLGGIGFGPSDDGVGDAAKDQLFRPGIDKIDDECALVVLVVKGVGLGSARPHPIVTVAVWPASCARVTPIGVLLDGNLALNEGVTNDIEVCFRS